MPSRGGVSRYTVSDQRVQPALFIIPLFYTRGKVQWFRDLSSKLFCPSRADPAYSGSFHGGESGVQENPKVDINLAS